MLERCSVAVIDVSGDDNALLLDEVYVASYRTLAGNVTEKKCFTFNELCNFLDSLPPNERKLWSFSKKEAD